ncbi:hypothetical protein P5704_025120 (plasmid) [Pseudomonas sp. FeN3W]|nr:hypothetical protein P5704_025120 [Pseudomonas sp. FeN3W]
MFDTKKLFFALKPDTSCPEVKPDYRLERMAQMLFSLHLREKEKPD